MELLPGMYIYTLVPLDGMVPLSLFLSRRRTPSRGKQAIGERATGEQATGEQATGAILELDGSHCNAAINAFAFARLQGRESSSLVNATLRAAQR